MNDLPHPEDFNVESIESPQIRELRQGFEVAEHFNREAIQEFDPDGAIGRVDIALSTADKELEAEMPQVAEAMRMNMLGALGLKPGSPSANDPRRLFEHQYSDGWLQIRTITRPDNKEVPIATHPYPNQANGWDVAWIELLSYDEAVDLKHRLEDNLDEQTLDRRLRNEFGLDDDFVAAADLSLEDKQAMMRSYDDMQAMEIAKPGSKELDKVRTRLLRSTLPTTTTMGWARERKAEQRTGEYEAAISQFTKRHELDDRTAGDLLASERLRRLSELNERLKTRAKTAKIGKTALMGTMVVVGTGSGIFTGAVTGAYFEISKTLPEIVGGGIGGGSGLWMAVEAAKNHRKIEASIKGFSAEDNTLIGDLLKDQIQAERALAYKYSFKLAQPK